MGRGRSLSTAEHGVVPPSLVHGLRANWPGTLVAEGGWPTPKRVGLSWLRRSSGGVAMKRNLAWFGIGLFVFLGAIPAQGVALKKDAVVYCGCASNSTAPATIDDD